MKTENDVEDGKRRKMTMRAEDNGGKRRRGQKMMTKIMTKMENKDGKQGQKMTRMENDDDNGKQRRGQKDDRKQ